MSDLPKNKSNETMTDEVTKKDWKEIKEMSKDIKEAVDFSMNDHILSLIAGSNAEPFYAYWSRRTTKIATLQVPTAGVSTQGGELIMYYNPIFMSKLTSKQVRGVIKHELLHLVLGHTAERKKDPPKVWNIATDCAINSLIPRDELPDIGIFPGGDYPKDMEGKPIKTPLTEFIKNCPPEKASDWYFSEIMRDEELTDYVSNSDDCEGQFDDHGGWEEATDEEREQLKGKLRAMLRQAVKEADAENKWGSIPHACREYLREMVSDQVDWKTLLKQFVGMAKSSRHEKSLKRLNKRFRGLNPIDPDSPVFPGFKRAREAQVRIYIDQSGSVGNDDIELFFGELRNLAKLTEFEVFFFDHEVDTKNMIKWKRGKKIPTIRTRMGGTSFDAVIDHANRDANDGKFQRVILMSDGEASQPPPSIKPLAYVLCPDRNLLFEARENELVIRMKRPAT